jgi:hypothetical protein
MEKLSDYFWPAGPVANIPTRTRGIPLEIMDIVQGFEFFKTNAIAARLYRANGEIVEPTEEGKKLLNAPAYISTFSIRHGTKPASANLFSVGHKCA